MAGRAKDMVASFAERLDAALGWDRVGRIAGVVTLYGLRHRLRERNLYEIGPPGTRAVRDTRQDAPPPRAARTLDGSHNDVEDRAMGAAGTRFGRNARSSRSARPPSAAPRPRR